MSPFPLSLYLLLSSTEYKIFPGNVRQRNCELSLLSYLTILPRASQGASDTTTLTNETNTLKLGSQEWVQSCQEPPGTPRYSESHALAGCQGRLPHLLSEICIFRLNYVSLRALSSKYLDTGAF